MTRQIQGITLNKLLRYKLIKDLYNKHKTEDIPDAVVLRKYIKPIYPISRQTLHKVLTTSVNRELLELEKEMGRQTTLEF